MSESSWSLGSSLSKLFGSNKITEETWEDLEAALLKSDFGADLTEDLVSQLSRAASKYRTDDVRDLKRMLTEMIEERLAKFDPTLKLGDHKPAVILVVGVNGVGKTTTIGKFANFLHTLQKKVVIAAADTFRAAAVEQLATWAERANAEIIKPEVSGQDPASVAFKAVQHAIDTGADVVLVDTAGRLQTKSGLMDELGKIRRVIEKLVPVSEVLLVLDATTGQNGLTQAEAFVEVAGVTGLVLTKLDGSAKGGFVIRVQEQTSIPVKLVGQGESIRDLSGFTAHVFAHDLVA